MIYWADRLLWSMACTGGTGYVLVRALDEALLHGWSSPWVWLHAIGFPGMIVGIARAWTVR